MKKNRDFHRNGQNELKLTNLPVLRGVQYEFWDFYSNFNIENLRFLGVLGGYGGVRGVKKNPTSCGHQCQMPTRGFG